MPGQARPAGGQALWRTLCIGLAGALFAILVGAAPVWANVPASARDAVQGRILAQELAGGQGFTVLHVWGSHYEMGYAHGYLMADYIELGYEEMMSVYGSYWPAVRAKVSEWTFRPVEIEEELQGILDGVRVHYPETEMDLLDLKAANTFGDWSYSFACRSTCCWDEWVAAPWTTISVRKLQFPILPATLTQQWHHVICAWQPDDGSPRWVNFSQSGNVCSSTGVNEFGTIASNHDWNSSVGPNYPDALPRASATRYSLTMDLGPDPLTHLQTVFAELGNYHVATGGFLNYYVPNGGAGVIKTSKSSGFYDFRLPQPEWMNGHVISTNNSDIDGKSGISPWVNYYNSLDPGSGVYATMEGLWDVAYESTDLHIAEIGFREREDMTLWFIGRLQYGNIPRLEIEWQDLFPPASGIGDDGPADSPGASLAVSASASYPNPSGGLRSGPAVTIPIRLSGASFQIMSARHPPRLAIYDSTGRLVHTLTAIHRPRIAAATEPGLFIFQWDGRDRANRALPGGVYHYRLIDLPVPICGGGADAGLRGRIVWLGE